jgi:predicted NodU family carbamoyl transferase
MGPRAFGNQDLPIRKPEMKEVLISGSSGESFRPFAPSVLLEAVDEYFEQNYLTPL